MSKITPKNLHYDTTLPPFLARLQSQNTNQDGRQDYHAARPKKPRDEEADREDEPVYFDEASGETLTKGEWEEREKFEGGGNVPEEEAEGKESGSGAGKEEGGEKKERGEMEKVAAIGRAPKRKAGKIIGGDEEEAGPAKKAVTEKKLASANSEGKKAEKEGKAAKKKKKVKLSFGDDE